MSRAARIVRQVTIGLSVGVVLILAAALLILRTARFQDWTKEKIAAAIAEGTGGKTEIGSFSLDVPHMQVRIRDLVIHGTEPPTAAPFVRVSEIDLTGRLFGGGRILGISYLGIREPEVNVIVFTDGRTNLPTPKPSAPSKSTPLETVVDLAVGHFELTQGHLALNNRKQPLDVAGNNLRAQLWYRLLDRDYTGRISLDPVYVVAGRNTPVTYRVTLPLVLASNRIRLEGATIATASSRLNIDGSIADLRQPAFSGRLEGWLALADLDHTLGLALDASGRGVPAVLQLDVNGDASASQVRLASMTLDLGGSHLQASGVLKGAGAGAGSSFRFDGSLALAELARLARLNARPEGALLLNGEAVVDAANRYQISGHVSSRGLAIAQGNLRIPSAALSTDVRVDPSSVELNALRLAALGGEFSGNARLLDFARYHLAGSLRSLDVQALGQLAGERLPYSGTISGPIEAAGDLHLADAHGVDARADLAIAPGARGIPLGGRLDAQYHGSSGDLQVENSFLQLPHTRLTLAGSTTNGLNVSLVTHDLHDLLAAAPNTEPPPVTLAGGQAGFSGTVTGPPGAPRVAGHLSATHFQVEGRQFTAFSADVAASSSGASVRNGALTRGAMSAAFSGAVGLRAWKPAPQDPVSADLNLQNGDLADLLSMAGEAPQGYSGALTVAAQVAGTVGNPNGSIAVSASNGALHGQPFDRIEAKVGLTDQLATIQQASLQAGKARVDLSGTFQHPRDSFSQGAVQATLRTSQVDLGQIQALPNVAGELQLSGAIAGSLGPAASNPSRTEFLVRSVQADASVHGLHYQGQPYGDLQTKVDTAGTTATISLSSDFAGSNVRLQGTTQLVPGYPTTADARIVGLPVERVLAISGHGDIPARGNLSATAHVEGALAHPQGNATLDLTNATVYGQPLDRLQVRAVSTAQALDLTQCEAVSGASHIALSARFDHPVDRLDTGTLQFRVENGRLDLGRLRAVQNARPGMAGSVAITADGSAAAGPGAPLFRLTSLNANVAATQIAVQGQTLGGFTLAAHTATGNRLDFDLNSNLAGATIQASGHGQLGGNYPVDAQLSFSNAKWTNFEKLLGAPSAGKPDFEVTAEGKAAVNGPILQTAALRGSLDLTRLDFESTAPRRAGHSITIQNQGPIEARLEGGAVTLEAFHLAGPQTDIQASGIAPLHGGSVNLTVNAGVDLAVLQSLSSDIDSSGKITVQAAVRGTLSNPLANGSLQLQNATFFYAGLPNGLSNGNGTILFQGNLASIQNLTGDSGGGKVAISGFANLGGNKRFSLHSTATGVRVRVQEGVTVMGNADLRVAGVLDKSTATGSVVLTQLNYAPQSDLGSILTRAAPEVQAATVPNPLLDHMKLDVRVRTSVAMRVKSSLAENLQTDANLHVGGTAARPSVLGRVDLDEGHLVFFGNTYTVNSGSISFADPVRIAPVLNISLETEAKGVKVTLNVSGPIDNMKLTYTSDPPLQFQEIVGLLSTGTMPTSDPTLLADQPPQPAQNFEQSGESAILGQAVANPVASSLQRVFGISQLQIAPTFTGSTVLPTAQVTIQQHVTQNITFTYTSALDDPNTTLISAEWALNPRWSATALRDQNGIVSVSLLYKKQFH